MDVRKTLILFYMAFCVMLPPVLSAQSSAAPPQPPDQKIRVLILSGCSDHAHPWLTTTIYLQQLLMNTGRFDVKVEEEVPGITAATLANYDVLVDLYQGPRWGDTTEHAVEDFLRSGKGMFAMHATLLGPFFGKVFAHGSLTIQGEPWAQFADMVGETWPLLDGSPHTRRHVFVVQWVDKDHPISKGLPPTFVANDELYHEMDLKPNAHVLAAAYDDPNIPKNGTGKMEPMVWTVPYGRGRVVVTTLGHDLLSMSQPGFINLFVRGVEWAATGKVEPEAPESQPLTGARPPEP